MSIAIIDTTVFCNIVAVSGLDGDRDHVLEVLNDLVREDTTLLLPMAAVLETGNHVAHCQNGQIRRKTAERFCVEVANALEGNAPWTPTPFWDMEGLRIWLGEFPNHAMKAVGMGDVSIIKEWERQCSLHQLRRVFIWSLDKHLSGYDRDP